MSRNDTLHPASSRRKKSTKQFWKKIMCMSCHGLRYSCTALRTWTHVPQCVFQKKGARQAVPEEDPVHKRARVSIFFHSPSYMDNCSEIPEKKDPPGSSVRRPSAQACTCLDILTQPYVQGHMLKNRSTENTGALQGMGAARPNTHFPPSRSFPPTRQP